MPIESHRDPRLCRLLALGVLALSTAIANPLSADWLITVDGERIETRGTWSVVGRSIRFENTRGVLTSIPAAAVDLDASREASAPPRESIPAPAQPRPSALVLTDRDIRPAPAPTNASAAEDASSAGEPLEAEADSSEQTPTAGEGGIAVSSWEEQESEQGLVFTGTVANDSTDAGVMSLDVKVELRDHDGEVVETRSAQVSSRALTPGQTTDFRVEFPDRFNYAEVVFLPSGSTWRTRGAPARASEPASEVAGEAAPDPGSESEPPAPVPPDDDPPPLAPDSSP
ncbi:MAG TPA: FxLYD domain-containing protein [Thermoanaerobaculia bacterium]|nr:FxLYD domain-containing protein [Thermoanaerobaculia bacterium]